MSDISPSPQPFAERLSDRLQDAIKVVIGSHRKPPRLLKSFLNGTWFGHPLHPVITDVPIATGLTDWSDTYGAERSIGLNHALFNASATILYLVPFILRLLAGPGDGIAAAILGFVGLACVFYAGYLGGELVFTKGTDVNHTAWETAGEDYEAVLSVERVEENTLYQVLASGVPVVVLRQGKQFYAISATCPHAGGPLDKGTLTGGVVECLWHGSRFCLRDGRVLTGPAMVYAPRYNVRVRNGQVEVKRGSRA